MSITRELREYVACWYHTRSLVDVADRIDERFSRELTAKQDEVDALQAKLVASILPPLDADGMAWHIGDKVRNIPDGRPLRVVAIGWEEGRATIVYTDKGELNWGHADKCHHVAPEPPESIDDVRKSCDNTVAYLASVSGMGWHDVGTFSEDVHEQLDRAYACGRRDGAGERA